MANYVIYTRINGSEEKLKLTAARTVELELHLGKSIPEAMNDIDKLTVASEFIASALTEENEYKERKNKALAIYDEFTENGKMMQDYQLLIFEVLVSAGFMKGEALTMQKKAIAVQEKLLAEKMTKLTEKMSEADL